MQVRVKKTKTGITVSIRAKKGAEGAHLAKAVLGCVGKGEVKTGDALTGILTGLRDQGYRAPGLVAGETPAVINLTQETLPGDGGL